MLVEGKQQWLFDETGRRYLDVSDLPRSPVCFAMLLTLRPASDAA